MATTEHTINDAIAELLRGTRWAWRGDDVVRSETTGLLSDSKMLQPDILIDELWIPPVVIESELIPAQGVEADALNRLGKEVRFLGEEINSVIALRLPLRLKETSQRKLKRELRNADDFQFALYSGQSAEKYDRYPESGWLLGGLHELSLLVQSATVPPALIERAATLFEMGINQAADHLKLISEKFPAAVQKIAVELHQQDSTQTRRMAMAILINAFIFHEHLARSHGELGKVRTLAKLEFLNDAGLQIPDILEDWNIILSVNYWPIFDIACRILRAIPNFQNNAFLKQLVRTAVTLLSNNLLRSHDLTGTVFQKLIADRKFLAAFYTKPASAALLAALAINDDTLLANGDWSNPEAIASLRIADFACGTGTLLSTVYQRVSQLHELHGGNTEAIHSRMMARALVGCDILPAAAHLTAASLAGAYPQVQYDESAIFTAPYGVQPDGEVKLGSIDLLRHGEMLEGLEITAKAIEATQGADVDIWRYAPHGSFDMVIMNPPFTRPNNFERRIPDTPNPNFAAFGATAAEQKAMAKEAKTLTKNTVAHGSAGEASTFFALADRKLKIGGMLALVMPAVFLTGSSWQKCRNRLAHAYKNLTLISIAGYGNTPLSFSADTGMGECLVIGQRSERPASRATFVVLNASPNFSGYSQDVARQLRKLSKRDSVRRLEDGPTGGSVIYFGDEIVAYAISAPLPKNGSWKLARIVDMSLAQSAYQLEINGQVWLPGQNSSESCKLPIATVGKIGSIGPYDLQVSKKTSGGSGRPFGLVALNTVQDSFVPTYPILWAHDADRERTMTFEADHDGIPYRASSRSEQKKADLEVAKIYKTASHCHFNRDFRFNSQSTSMQFTERKTIGGRAWTSISLSSAAHEKVLVLWSNSTLGMLMYWWIASKQQPGRGNITKSSLKNLPILNIISLDYETLRGGGRALRRTQTPAAQAAARARHRREPQDPRPALLRRSARLARRHPR